MLSAFECLPPDNAVMLRADIVLKEWAILGDKKEIGVRQQKQLQIS